MLAYTIAQKEMMKNKLGLERRVTVYLIVYNNLSEREFEKPEVILKRIESKIRYSMTRMQLVGILTVLSRYGLALRKQIKVRNGKVYLYKRGKSLNELRSVYLR